MQLGIFAKTFARPTLDGVLDAVIAHGLDCIQFNFSCAGLPGMPDRIGSALTQTIRSKLAERRVTMAAVSGTFNMIHPDARVRESGLRRLEELAAACSALGTRVITLCTGTRDPENMWRHHPDNATPAAWGDLTASMQRALTFAEAHDVMLAIEPETANVVDSAPQAARLLRDMKAGRRLKIVMDPANLFQPHSLPRMRDVLDEAFSLLRADIILAHAKDVTADGHHVPAGRGLLDYDHYLELLSSFRFRGPVILHSLSEDEVDGCVRFLRQKMDDHSTSQPGEPD